MKGFILLLFCIGPFLTQTALAQNYGVYTGKRIHISSAKILSDSKRSIKIGVIIANTGRQDIRLHSGLNKQNVVFTFGSSIDDQAIAPYKDLIVSLLLENNTQLRAGQLLTPKPIKIKKAWLNEKVMPSEPINLEPPVLAVQKSPAKKKSKISTPEQTRSPIGRLPKPESSTVSTSKQKKKSEPKNTGRTMSPIGELPKPEKGLQCYDLMLDNLQITKRTKRNIIIAFDLINYGEGVFSFNRKDPTLENLSIKAFFASIPRLTRGSLIAGGEHFDEIFKEKKFNLAFGEHIQGSIKIPLEKMTKWTPVIILEVDPFSTIRECDKVNNVSTTVLK